MVYKSGFRASVAAVAVLAAGGFYLARANDVPSADKTVKLLAASAVAQESGYLPDPNRGYPTRVLWGDEHVHTGWSVDAGVAGATLTPEDAVRFVRGETVKSNTGQQAKLQRPLDWVAVTDHSDGMGTIAELQAGNPEFMKDPVLKRWHDMMAADKQQASAAAIELMKAAGSGNMPGAFKDPKWVASAWQKTVDIMEKYNEPGKFTAFISYEWTSMKAAVATLTGTDEPRRPTTSG